MSYEQNLDLKPNLRPLDFEKNKKKTTKNQLVHQLADRPVMVKTTNYDEETSNALKLHVELSLNKDNRWEVLEKPYLLRQDTDHEDFRVVEHAVTRNSNLMSTNADVTKVYIENEDLEVTKATKGGKTTLKSLTHVPEEKEKKSRKSKKSNTPMDEVRSHNDTDDEPKDTVSVQYDIYKAHTNPIMLKEKKSKGSKRSTHRNWNMSEIEEELECYYDDEEEEPEELQKKSNKSIKSEQFSTSSASKLEVLSNEELEIIKKKVFLPMGNPPTASKYPRISFSATQGKCIYNYRDPISYIQTEHLEKMICPLKMYQLYIAKRNIEETEKMNSEIVNRIRTMFTEHMRRYSKDYTVAKLIYSKDEVYINATMYGQTTVRIIPKTMLMESPMSHYRDTITNQEMINYVDEPLEYGFMYADLIIDEKWVLCKLDEQLEPSVEFIRGRKWLDEGFKPELKRGIKMAIEKTIHQSPIAVCFSASSRERDINIIVRKNWKQQNQSVVYSSQVKYGYEYNMTHGKRCFFIQFVMLL